MVEKRPSDRVSLLPVEENTTYLGGKRSRLERQLNPLNAPSDSEHIINDQKSGVKVFHIRSLVPISVLPSSFSVPPSLVLSCFSDYLTPPAVNNFVFSEGSQAASAMSTENVSDMRRGG